MAAFTGYITKWATPAKLKLYGVFVKRELRDLTPGQLNNTLEVLRILTGMVGDEINERTASTSVQRRS